MQTQDLLSVLNPAQRAAVAADPGHLLILAGAGSGKTRVLTHRIAWLVQQGYASPHGVLAVTFTNKAAREMRARIEALLGFGAGTMWVGTFHGLAHRLLRLHWQDAGLPQSFTILDSDDQQRLVKRIIKEEMQLDDGVYPPRQAAWYINGKKDEGIRPEQIPGHHDPFEQVMREVYARYDQACQRSGQVDFAELLLRAFELLLARPDLLDHYQQRFRHILVDEFQDTNSLQYKWLRLLAGDSGQLFIVGDDDQSIYGWRGARIEHIQRLAKDLPELTTLRLEQNYRSTATILDAANALIANNSGRLGKNLWTEGRRGDAIRLYTAFNEIDEARYVVERVEKYVAEGGRREECAVLYRSNAQSRVVEEALLMAGVPYRIYGGQRFFDRAEIKDALAYLRLMENPHDDPSFERVVNTPSRGIGDRTVETLRELARSDASSLWTAALKVVAERRLAARALSALANFLALIDALINDGKDQDLHRQAELVVERSALGDYYLTKEKGEKGRARVDNLKELVNAAREYEYTFQELDDEWGEMAPLTAFLANAALEAGEEQAEEGADAVQLMTLHSAKGLEFPQVFMVGMEEGLFPSRQSHEDPSRMEEERRLAYVGMTRAMRVLTLSHAEVRRLYGQENYARPSRFLREIPKELMEEVRMQGSVQRPSHDQGSFGGSSYGGGSYGGGGWNRGSSPAPAAPKPKPAASVRAVQQQESGLRLGQRVRHAKFGEGVVVNIEGQGARTEVMVNFEKVGSKRLNLAYAKLEAL